MLLVLDLGFSALVVLLACAVFPLIGLVLRSKWRRSAARKEEIRRLIILASEETARAELEASAGYGYSYVNAHADGYGAVSGAQSNLCAVCYSPSTTRCAKCKAARYCSGKCQIIHWRQGHKDECYAPPVKSDFYSKLSKHEQDFSCGSDLDDENGLQSKSALLNGETKTVDSNEASKEKPSNLEVELNAGNSSDSSKTGFTGFSSPVGYESSDDASMSDIISSNDSGSSDGHISDDAAHDKGRSSSTAEDVTISSKLSSSVDSFHSCSGSSELNHHDPGCYADKTLGTVIKPLKAERTRNMMSGCTSGLETETLRSLEDGFSISLRANVFSGSQEDTLSSESTHNASAGACESCRHLDSIVRSGKADEVNAAAEAAYSEVAGLSMNTRSATKTSVEKSVDQLKESILSQRYSLRGGSDIGARYSGKGLFPYEFFVKLYTWKEVELHPCGLINCGNSCYANAVLQCLAFTPPLTAYFLQGLHSKICAKKDWCLMCEFESLILKAKEGESPISPFRIVSRVENIGSQLSNGREEDAHEFLRYAIDEMGSVCLMESRLSSGSPEEDTSLIGLTFGGYLRSKIRCTKCQGKSEQHERMMDLTVEVEGDVGTLEEALQRFTVSEMLDGENKYQCSRCGSYEKARKKLTILEAPNVLTIALKRFQSGKCGKLNKFIGYPEILNLAPYMSGTSDKSPVYRLYGVIVHLDVVNASYSGHYICYVKNPQNKWFKIDDSIVTPVDMETVLKVGAYMLLYSRCSPRAPRSLRNQLVVSDPKPKLLPSRVMSKVPVLNSEKSGDPSHDDLNSKWMSLDRLASIESFYSKFHMLQRIIEEDSPSDCSSLFSNNSDESSSSSDGTRESTCTPDDFSEYLFGGRSSPWRNSSELDSSSSSSSSSPMASSNSRVRGLPEPSKPQVDAMANDSFLHRGASGSSLLYSDSSISSGKYSNSSGDLERPVDAADGFDGVKSGRKSATTRA